MKRVQGRSYRVTSSKLGSRIEIEGEGYSFSFDLFHPMSSTKFMLLNKYQFDQRGEILVSPGAENFFTFPVAFNNSPVVLVLAVSQRGFLRPRYPVVSDVFTTGFRVYCPAYKLEQDQVRLLWFGYVFQWDTLSYWREALLQAIEYCAHENYRSALVEADAAFEAFLSDYLAIRFAKLRMPELNKALRDSREIVLKSVVSSPAISRFDYKEEHKTVYERCLDAHRIRNKVVHGTPVHVTKQDAYKAILSILSLISIIDPLAFSKRFVKPLMTETAENG